MNQQAKLQLPKKDRPKGLYLFCNTCKRSYSHDKLVKCRCGNLVYKARIHVSGTSTGLIPKVLKAKDFSNAIQEFFDFKKTLISNSYQPITIKKEVKLPARLIECFAYYIAFLNNEGVVPHKKKKRDPDHIRKVDLSFELFLKALQQNGINTGILKFTEVNDEMVGFVHKLFLEDMGLANKTYNNRMALLRTFTSHMIKDLKCNYENPFLGVQNLILSNDVTAIEQNEFEKLMLVITPENGIQKRVQKGRENLRTTTWYKPWLKHGIQLGLFTGGRADEIVLPKWTDIVLTSDGQFDTIKTIDYKIDRANNNLKGNGGAFYKYFPITKELGKLLLEIGYEEYKNSDKYILAPEETMKRSSITKFLSEGFTHYYKQIGKNPEITFNKLRKAYITSAMGQFGDSSTALSNHKNISISIKNYQDKKVTRDAAKETFSVFKSKKT